MRLATRGGISTAEKQAFRFFRLRKRLRQFLKYRPGCPKTVLYIVGCQRSGTTMIHHLFRLDPDTVTYDEMSPLSLQDPRGFRLDPREAVQARIAAERAPLVVAKPLVESQRVRELLDWFPDARAVWIYRDYRDVALSNIKHFGEDNGHRDLAPILAADETNWRAQHMAPDDVARLRDVYSPDLNPHAAAALFWWARNSLWFSRGCGEDDRVALCRYGDLVGEPAKVMRRAYAFVGRPYPGDRIVKDVFTGSRGRGRDVELPAPVRAMCEEMLSQLDGAAGVRIDLRGGDA